MQLDEVKIDRQEENEEMKNEDLCLIEEDKQINDLSEKKKQLQEQIQRLYSDIVQFARKQFSQFFGKYYQQVCHLMGVIACMDKLAEYVFSSDPANAANLTKPLSPTNNN